MRIAIWSYTAAIATATAAVAIIGALFESILPSLFHGKPLPPLTSVLTLYHWWFLNIPIPWIFAAVFLSREEMLSLDRVVAFAGISTFTITALLAFMAFALTLPFVTLCSSI